MNKEIITNKTNLFGAQPYLKLRHTALRKRVFASHVHQETFFTGAILDKLPEVDSS